MTRLAFLSLWLLVFTIPWQNALVVEAFGTIARLVGVLAFGLTILSVIADGKIRPLSVIQMLIMLFLVWAVLTSAWTISPVSSESRVPTYVQLLLMVWMIWQLTSTPERQRSIVKAFVLGTTVSAIVIIWNRFAGGVALDAGRYQAAGMATNELGYMFALGLAMCCYLAATEQRAWMFWFYASLLGAFQVGVLLTGSRGATVASAVAWLFLPWVFVRLKVYKKGAAVALLAGLVTAALAIVPPTTWQRLGETGTEIQTGSFSRRGPIWQAGWEVFQNNPIAGIGAGAFNASVAGKLVGATAPHNVFLAVGVEMGLVGLALLAGLLLCLFLGCRQLPRFERRLALILMMTWGMASMASNCEYKKETWLVFGLLSVQVGNRLRMGMEVRRSSATIDEKGFAY